VAYWRLDEASGTRADSSGNGYTLTDNNTVGSATGNLSALAADFVNTSSEYLSTTNAVPRGTIVGASSWTICMWINPTNISGARSSPCGTFDAGFSGLLPFRRAPEAAVDGVNNDQVQWQFWNDSGTPYNAEVSGANGRTAAGSWSFISCQLDSATSKLRSRTNATASADTTVSGTFSANAQFDIGRRGNGGLYWSGRIAHVGLWSRALSGAELDSLYNSGAGLDPTASSAAKGLPIIAHHYRAVFGG
jgi:hypothetical protein